MIESKSVLHYDLIEKIADGHLGEVYLALDKERSQQVALRILGPGIANDSEKVLRIGTSVREAAALNHPSIATVYGLWSDSDSTFLVTEYVSGSRIGTQHNGKTFPLRQAVDLGLQIAEALSEASDKSVVHGGIKPSNVLITSSGRVKLLDFGFPPDLHHKMPGMDMDEIPYRSPENLSQAIVDHRSDVYAAGILLYEMINARQPFAASSVQELREKIMRRQPALMCRPDFDMPTELLRTVGRCLQKDPARRYQTASELAADLTNIKATLQFF